MNSTFRATLRHASLLLALTATVSAQNGNPTTDYPQGRDWSFLTRPAGAIIASSSHTDSDEFVVPLSASSGGKFARSITAMGPVDYLTYAGPPTTSTLSNFTALSAQAVAAGFAPVFTCVRAACGGFDYAETLFKPLADSLSGSPYMNFTMQALGAYTSDVRSTSFKRGAGEYLVLTTALAPGTYSGVLLIKAGGSSPIGPAAIATHP